MHERKEVERECPWVGRLQELPQLVLGLTFNWGALLGWAAVHGSCDWSVVLPLYASGVSWTIVYDTIYAHQDTKDDAALGLKSTALLMGENTPMILSGFAVTTVGGMMLAGYNCHLAWPFYVGAATAGGHLAWQLGTMNMSQGSNLQARFGSNR